MASLIENLIEELNEEYAIYEELLIVSREKTSAIVSNNLDRLRETTDKEQLYVDALTGLENKRRDTMHNIATVINRSKENIKVTDIIDFLDGQTDFQEPLMVINEKLAKIAKNLKEVNGHNQNLIQESLSMIEYNINLMQNLTRAPETAEYSKDMFRKNSNYSGATTMERTGNFDTSQ